MSDEGKVICKCVVYACLIVNCPHAKKHTLAEHDENPSECFKNQEYKCVPCEGEETK